MRLNRAELKSYARLKNTDLEKFYLRFKINYKHMENPGRIVHIQENDYLGFSI